MGRLPARHLSKRSDSPETGPSRGREPAAAVLVCAGASTSRPRRAPGWRAGRGRGVACTNGIAGVGRPQLRAKFNREFWCCPRTRVFTVAVMVRSLNCIVAVSQNMGIGKNGDLPWPPLRNEFKYFQRMTTTSSEGKRNLVIMGRKTWFSIPKKNRPLKDRINLVLSRELKEPPKGAHFLAKSLDDALKLIEQPELRSKVDMVWIVGGSSVYKEAMSKPGHIKLFVTKIMQEFESDTFFPEIDLGKYKLLPEYPGVLSDVQEEKGIKYKFEVYEKND
ncbi:dihydrofolate reductase isoform X2 [Pteropus alecto]|nr:dihydrofolate reductase isoform X2 [Pteropus alecto]